MKNVYVANVVGDLALDEPRPVGSPPLLVGEEGVIFQYGDREGGTLTVVADDENDAERRIIATFGDNVTVDDLQLAAPVPDEIERGLRNLAHARQPCGDPDCEIHHPEVIEGPSMLTALAHYEAGRRSTDGERRST